MPNSNIIKRLQATEDRLNKELENAHGEFKETKTGLENKIQLYQRYQMEDRITELERLMLSNKQQGLSCRILHYILHTTQRSSFCIYQGDSWAIFSYTFNALLFL